MNDAVMIVEAFAALKKVMKSASMAALASDNFSKTLELTKLIEDLAGLETRAKLALSAEGAPSKADRRPAPEVFPRFLRQGSLMVKIGLRRDGDSTYEQKMSREVFDVVLATLRSLKDSQSEFHPSELISRLDCPSYQAYMVLNVLQVTGHLENPQKGLYRFGRTAEKLWAGGVWAELPEPSFVRPES